MYDLSGTGARRSTLLLFALAGVTACSGNSCVGPLKGGFPLAQRHENGIQTRLTKTFFDFAGANAGTIIPSLLSGGTTFTIPSSCGGSTEVCCTTPATTCQIMVDPRDMQLTPQAPNKIHFDAHVLVKTLNNLQFKTSGVECFISVDTQRSIPVLMRAQGDVTLAVNPDTHLTGMAIENVSISDLDDGDVNLDEPGSDFACKIGNFALFKGLVLDVIKKQVSSMVGGLTEGLLCQTCQDKSDCSALATACADGKCLGPDGKTCIQMLGVEGKASLGGLLSGLAPSQSAMDLLEAAGGYSAADTGLSLGVLGGSKADPHDPCVPLVAPPTAVEPAPSPSFQGDVIPGTSTPYHVGIGVHVSHLTTLGYSIWDAGGLCLSVSSQSFEQLSTASLSLIMPSLNDLVGGKDAAMAIRLRPQNPPSFVLGKGTFKMQNGQKVVDDPLLTLSAKDFIADFYLFVDDRYVRVATLTADLVLPLNLDVDMNGTLVGIPGDPSKVFSNLRATNSELLAESPAELEAAFPTIFGAALTPLFSNLSFSLPAFAGMRILPTVITSTDAGADGHGQFLAVYGDVKTAMNATLPVRTQAKLVAVSTPPTEVFSVRGRDGRVPSITVEVGGEAPGRAVEWSWSLDGGAWHAYAPAGTLTLTDPLLWLQGRHVVRLRARAVGEPTSLDPTPVGLQLYIDSEAPYGDFSTDGDRIVPSAGDRVCPEAALRYRVGQGDFVRADELRLPAGADPAQVIVEAKDEAGNVARLPYRAPAALKPLGCAMAPGASSTETGGLGLVVLAVAALLARRRAALAALLVLCLEPACHHDPEDGDKLSPGDAIGRTHDVRVHDGELHIVAYDATYGDLAYGKVGLDALAQPFDWLLVDGDDPGSPSDSPTPFRHGHTAPGPDVGYYASIAVTSDGDPRIAYFDATNGTVKYARGGFPFETHEIDRGSDDGSIVVGMYPSIALNAYDTPSVAYMVNGLGDGTNGFRSELRIARAKSSSPSSHSDWDISVVDTTPISCAGRCPSGTACVITATVGGMPNTNPASSTCQALSLAPCMPGCSSDQACVQNACRAAAVKTGPDTLPDGTGLFAKLLSGPGGKLALVYHDRTLGQLRVATEGDDGKLLPAAIAGKMGGLDVGQFASAGYGSDGVLHIAYVDAQKAQLLYRSITASGTPSQVEVVDNGLRDDGPHPVGASASVDVVGNTPYILYQDQATSDLLIAQKSGTWSHRDVRVGADGVGFSSHLVDEGGKQYYTSFVFDRSATPLGRLLLDAVP